MRELFEKVCGICVFVFVRAYGTSVGDVDVDVGPVDVWDESVTMRVAVAVAVAVAGTLTVDTAAAVGARREGRREGSTKSTVTVG